MVVYKYNKRENKFTENGHTMFEEDVLQRLKRLAYLESHHKPVDGGDSKIIIRQAIRDLRRITKIIDDDNRIDDDVTGGYLEEQELAYIISINTVIGNLWSEYKETSTPDVKDSELVNVEKYGFLYWLERDDHADDCRCKWIKANNIEEACEKFKKAAPKTLARIDYEVQLGDEYIDVSGREDFQFWM